MISLPTKLNITCQNIESDNTVDMKTLYKSVICGVLFVKGNDIISALID